MYDQVVESCDCVDEETECSDARVQGDERIQQVWSVAGNTSEEFAISVITDTTGESCRTFNSVTHYYGIACALNSAMQAVCTAYTVLRESWHRCVGAVTTLRPDSGWLR